MRLLKNKRDETQRAIPKYLSNGITVDLESKEAIVNIFTIWDLIKTEEDYQKFLEMLPQHNFLPYNKICKSGFRFVEI